MSEPAYTPKSEYQCDGSTTHYQGCKCHESRWSERLESAEMRVKNLQEGNSVIERKLIDCGIEIKRLRNALAVLRDGPGNRMSSWPGTWTHEVASAALTDTEKES